MSKRESDSKLSDESNKKMTKIDRLSVESNPENENKEHIDYNMPKPGPHAKAGEWRKWKMMKRAIRQEREEKRILKQKEKDSATDMNSPNQNGDSKKNFSRPFSLSIAIPGSLLFKIQSKELKTFLIGQIARAATLFCVDEIIVYNELTAETKINKENNEQFIKILEYLECPQYLRKALFPPNKHLEHVGLLPPIEAPHHFKINDNWTYREGVTTDIPSKDNKGSWVDIGLMNKIEIDKKLEPGIRVTVKKLTDNQSKKLRGIAVSPETPKQEMGLYWGYQVRYADSFKKILTESCFGERYDLKIAINLNNKLNLDDLVAFKEQNNRRVLIVYGGIAGIEAAIEADEKFKANKMNEVFDFVAEADEDQFGSRSMRLEEAVFISLTSIKALLKQNCDQTTEVAS